MRILIADDVDVNRISLQRFLEKMGHEVITCIDGQEVVDKMSADELPQLIFLDWIMPKVSGLDVCKKIRENQSLINTYVVMVTSKTEVADVIEGLRAGANDYITKPVNADELAVRVRVAMQMIDLQNTVAEQKAKLIASEKMACLGEMASGIVHEIESPISIILNQIKKMNVDSEFKINVAADKTILMAKKVSKLLESLKNFTADAVKEKFLEVPVREILSQVFSFCHEKLRANEVEFRLKPFNEELICEIQNFHLIQALMGLVQNSIEAVSGQPERWVEVEIFESDGLVHFSVTDSGFGIVTAVQERMMQPFFSTKKSASHSGLGLSLVRGIAENHHGRLSYDSKSFNTRFIFSIPKSQPKSACKLPSFDMKLRLQI